MVRLEPGDEPGAIPLRHFAKPDEGAHLVDVAAHRFRQRVDPPEQRIGAVLHQAGPIAHPHEQGVEQGEAFGVAVQDRAVRQVEKGARDRKGGAQRRGRQRRVAEQVGGGVPDLPDDRGGIDPGHRQPPRRRAPSVNVVRRSQDDAVHGRPFDLLFGLRPPGPVMRQAPGRGTEGTGALNPPLGRAPVRRACAWRTARPASVPLRPSNPWRRRGTSLPPPPRYGGDSAFSSPRISCATPRR